MRGAIACVCALVGCGRIAFDPGGDGGAAQGTGDAVDAQEAACAGFDVVIDLPQAPSVGTPGIVWTGSEYYVVIRDPNFALQQIGPDGTAGAFYDLLPAVEVLSGIAWSGSTIGVVSYSGGGGPVRWRGFDPVTHTMSSPATVNQASAGDIARIAWAGDRFIIGWHDNANVWARELAATGVPLSTELLLSTTGGSVSSIAVTPSTYVFGVDTSSGGRLVVTYQRSSQLIQTQPVDVGTTNAVMVVARSDGRFASTCGAWQSGTTLLQLHDTDGSPIGAGIPSPLTTGAAALYSTIEPTATGYRLSGVTGADPHDILRAEIDASGNVTLPVTAIGTFTASSYASPGSLATAGRSLFAAGYDGIANPTHLRLIQTCD